MRQLGGAIGEVIHVQVSIELDDQRVGMSLSSADQLFVHGQNAQVVARDPQQELPSFQRLANDFSGLIFPILIGRESGESK